MLDRRAKRARILKRMLNTAEFLSERFPEHMTLAELRTALIGHLAILDGQPISVSQLSEMSGQHRQTVSRWLRRSPYVRLIEHPDDGRVKIIEATDPESMFMYLDRIWLSEMSYLQHLSETGRLAVYISNPDLVPGPSGSDGLGSVSATSPSQHFEGSE